MSPTLAREIRCHLPTLIKQMVIVFICGAVALVLLEQIVNTAGRAIVRALPASYWFTYHGVAASGPVTEGHMVEFVSDAEFRRTADFFWNDVLFCDLRDGRGFRSYRSVNASRDARRPEPRGTKAWVLPVPAPRRGSVCFGEHNITARVAYGIVKRQTIRSEPFTVR